MAIAKATATLKNVRREVSKLVRSEDGRSYTRQPNGVLVGDVRITVDLESLMLDLGPKALGSKGKRSRLHGGDVLVEAINVRREKS